MRMSLIAVLFEVCSIAKGSLDPSPLQAFTAGYVASTAQICNERSALSLFKRHVKLVSAA